MFSFRSPIEIQFKNDDFGIKRMIFKIAVASLAVGAVGAGVAVYLFI